MDPLITAAARSLAAGNPLGILKRVALRGDAPALALRGIVMRARGSSALAISTRRLSSNFRLAARRAGGVLLTGLGARSSSNQS
jgi:hypothetical protein